MLEKAKTFTQNGMALLEVMVAVVVLSLGLLGVAGMQLAGMRSNQVAYYRSVATMQAYDMADRIRAGMNTNAYTPVTAVDTSELGDWKAKNASLLPGGGGDVTIVGNRLQISVQWREKCTKGESDCVSGSLTRSFVTEFVP